MVVVEAVLDKVVGVLVPVDEEATVKVVVEEAKKTEIRF